jgi:hypothetical protein
MGRGWWQFLGNSGVACLALVGCNDTSEWGPCAMATFELHALEDSSATWTIGQSPAQTSTGVVPSYAAVGQCSFGYQGVVYESGREHARPGLRVFGCEAGHEQAFNYLGLDLGDPRGWSVRTYTWKNEDGAIECSSYAPTSGPAGNPCLHASLDSVSVKVDVETAIGGKAPVPKLVTDDFVRTFRVEFDTSGATARVPFGEVCDFPVTVKASLHLTQTAADYVFDADAPCPL